MGILKNYEGVCGDFFFFFGKNLKKFTFPTELVRASDENRHRRESESVR